MKNIWVSLDCGNFLMNLNHRCDTVFYLITGQGYATEGSHVVINYAFKELGCTYLIASLDPPNVDSQRVAERLGMQFVEERTEQGRPIAFFRRDKEAIA